MDYFPQFLLLYMPSPALKKKKKTNHAEKQGNTWSEEKTQHQKETLRSHWTIWDSKVNYQTKNLKYLGLIC